jgi:cobalt-precorrin 5A hydrolase/precorrin-3B C17-methyltransferase
MVGEAAVGEPAEPSSRGRLALIGIGPGARDLMTARAIDELRGCSVVVGRASVIDQIADLLQPGTETLAREEDPAHAAVKQAQAGQSVALVGSGDAGVFAMASSALEMYDGSFDVVAVPGVTAALAAAAVLGAPLAHDHAMISLSDEHTPWELIARRVRAAAEADLVICFYNPVSARRTWQLQRALELLARHRPTATPVGWVRDASRPGQQYGVSTLADFDPAVADVRTMVIVGSSRTRIVAGEMVTPRDYRWEAE